MVLLAGIDKSIEKARVRVKKTIDDGSALEKFKVMLKAQGGDVRIVDDYSLLPVADEHTTLLAPKSGYVKSFINDQIGLLLIELGGGRKSKDDQIDHSVGFVFHKKVGDQVKKGEPVMTIVHHASQTAVVAKIIDKMNKEVMTITTTKVKPLKMIVDKVI
jgi:pyrimidine-nucleoside phosphorylase